MNSSWEESCLQWLFAALINLLASNIIKIYDKYFYHILFNQSSIKYLLDKVLWTHCFFRKIYCINKFHFFFISYLIFPLLLLHFFLLMLCLHDKSVFLIEISLNCLRILTIIFDLEQGMKIMNLLFTFTTQVIVFTDYAFVHNSFDWIHKTTIALNWWLDHYFFLLEEIYFFINLISVDFLFLGWGPTWTIHFILLESLFFL